MTRPSLYKSESAAAKRKKEQARKVARRKKEAEVMNPASLAAEIDVIDDDMDDFARWLDEHDRPYWDEA
jgi:hypothetical protein